MLATRIEGSDQLEIKKSQQCPRQSQPTMEEFSILGSRYRKLQFKKSHIKKIGFLRYHAKKNSILKAPIGDAEGSIL